MKNRKVIITILVIIVGCILFIGYPKYREHQELKTIAREIATLGSKQNALWAITTAKTIYILEGERSLEDYFELRNNEWPVKYISDYYKRNKKELTEHLMSKGLNVKLRKEWIQVRNQTQYLITDDVKLSNILKQYIDCQQEHVNCIISILNGNYTDIIGLKNADKRMGQALYDVRSYFARKGINIDKKIKLGPKVKKEIDGLYQDLLGIDIKELKKDKAK